MHKVLDRKQKSISAREKAEQQKRARELEEEFKNDQKRIQIINRKKKAKDIGRTNKKEKPRGLPKDLKLGDCVLIKQGIGIVRFIGPVEGAKKKEHIYAGIELKDEKAIGMNDGSAFGNRYFQCEDKKGVFVRNVPKILPPEKLLLKLGKLNKDLQEMAIEQMKLHNEVDRLEKDNLDIRGKFEEAEAKAKKVEELSIDEPTLPKQVNDDEKLETTTDGNRVNDISNRVRASIERKTNENLEKKKKALFRIASGDLWSENDVLDLESELQKQLEKGQREQALMALDLPDFNAPDNDFVQWLTQRFQQFQKVESQFQVPDIGDPKVKRAILIVTRMLASFTQQINKKASKYITTKSLLSSLDERVDEDDDDESFLSSSDSSSEGDF